jgi:hypothetical protein
VWWLEPILLTVLGAALGLADISAPEASGWLRVPALIAALLLAAQGLLDLENARRAKATHTPAPLPAVPAAGAAPPPTPEVDSPGRAAHRDEVVQVSAKPLPGSGVRENRNVVAGVMGLSIWLGLATLSFPNEARPLVSLSLLAAFLLFANGWAMLRGRR